MRSRELQDRVLVEKLLSSEITRTSVIPTGRCRSSVGSWNSPEMRPLESSMHVFDVDPVESAILVWEEIESRSKEKGRNPKLRILQPRRPHQPRLPRQPKHPLGPRPQPGLARPTQVALHACVINTPVESTPFGLFFTSPALFLQTLSFRSPRSRVTTDTTALIGEGGSCLVEGEG